MLHVISTGFRAPTRDRCEQSVEMQWPPVRHVYIEASEQRPPLDVISNLLDACAKLAPEDVVVWLDGDDWLARGDACLQVAAMHEDGAWVTWGSFEYADGRPGFAEALRPGFAVRQHPWVTTHLKTFRAGLVQRLRAEDVTWPHGAQVPWDMVVMFACIEMAGPRIRFCPDVLSVYNFASSNEFRNGASEERRIEQVIRARKPYDILEAL